MDKFNDILYEVSDLLLGFVVLLVIVSTVGWQLYGWFEPGKAQATDKVATEITVEKKEINMEDKENENKKIEVKEVIRFEIKPGEAGVKIAENLKHQGFIDSPDEFLNMLKKSNLENSMKAGTYSITKGSTMEEIVHILTK